MRRVLSMLVLASLTSAAVGCVSSDRVSGRSTPPQRDVHGQIEKPGEGEVEVRLLKF